MDVAPVWQEIWILLTCATWSKLADRFHRHVWCGISCPSLHPLVMVLRRFVVHAHEVYLSDIARSAMLHRRPSATGSLDTIT